jgi:hypothetical protein
MKGFRSVKAKEMFAKKLLKHVHAPKDLTVQLARNTLQAEPTFKAMTPKQQEKVLAIFDDEWAKLDGPVISGFDVVEVPKRIHARVQVEVVRV